MSISPIAAHSPFWANTYQEEKKSVPPGKNDVVTLSEDGRKTRGPIRDQNPATPASAFGGLYDGIAKTGSRGAAQVPSNNETEAESYLSQLKQKFGDRISVRDVDKSKSGINATGRRTAGTGNITIAPNILEKMAEDPQAREHYEQKIQAHFDTNAEANAFMAMRGRQITSRGVIVHPNGEVTYYCNSEPTPEEKARLEEAMKAEDEAKAAKRLEEELLLEEWREQRRAMADEILMARDAL